MIQSIKLMVIVAFALVCAFASTQVFVPSADAAYTDTDGDGVSDVAEEVFGSNPNAGGSTPETAGDPIIFPGSCGNAIDDDGDGTTDAADAGCVDSDSDLFSDQVELQLGSNPDDADYYPEDSRLDSALISVGVPVRFCTNGEDDDDDGLEDGADPGCDEPDEDGDGFADLVEKDTGSDPGDDTSVPEHALFNDGSCSDGDDNDLDGDLDGADEGCVVLANDDLQDALEFDSLPFSHTTKVLNATVQPSERESDCILGSEQDNTVWYKFVAGQSGNVVIDATESDFAPIVSVWIESTFGLTGIECVHGFNYYTLGPQARLSFPAEAGRTYFIQVSTEEQFHLASGRLVLSVEAGSPPANDDLADAATVSQLPYTTSVDTISATTEAAEPVSSCIGGFGASAENTVWYKYTPAADGYLNTGTTGTAFLYETLAVYTRNGTGDLSQVACSYPVGPFFFTGLGPRAAFLAEAGQTYYIQAGTLESSEVGQSGRAGHSNSAVAGAESRGVITLTIQTFTPPPCPAPQYTVQDPMGDAFGGPGPDIEGLATAFTGDNLCIAIDMRGPVDPGLVRALLSIDTDMNRDTGYDDIQYDCGYPTGLGLDTSGLYDPTSGLLMIMASFGGGEGPYRLHYGFARLDNGVFHMAIPREAFGGDSAIRFVASVLQLKSYVSDCVPNGGNMTCGQNGACAFSPFRNGDANCATGANAIDAAIILQYGAGLLSTLSCPDAADVDGNGIVDSRDAALVLQFAAGLLQQLPPFLFFEG